MSHKSPAPVPGDAPAPQPAAARGRMRNHEWQRVGGGRHVAHVASVARVARARVQTGSVSGRVEQLRHGHRVAPLQPPHQRVLLLECADFIFI